MPLHEGLCVGIVEDDQIMGESLLQRLMLEGYSARLWRSGAEALEYMEVVRPDLLVCDIRLPDMNGEEIFRKSLPFLGSAPVIFITAFADIDQAVRLVRAGAVDYITKPFAMDDFLDRLDRLLNGRTEANAEPDGTLGASPLMKQVESILRRVADVDSTLLFTGKSGVGKEVAAHFVHRISNRAEEPFIAVNCAAIPPNLLESELFGHEKGAFTDAKTRHEGYAERARDGILFLDEISELSVAVQAKLLRLIQERNFNRVGGQDNINFRARLLCSTNVDLEERMREGTFREDLYYRINVIQVDIPPLRERSEDIAPLLNHYLSTFTSSFDSEVRGITTIAEEMALFHDWPGNVRELRNRMERAVALARSSWIVPADMFPEFCTSADSDYGTDPVAPLSEVREAAERRHIMTVLDRTEGQVKKAAGLLGVSRTTLWEKMRKLQLSTDISTS